MEKTYEPHKSELEIYEKWEKLGLFKPNDSKKTFTIAIPPPNVTGNLHLGHAIMIVIEDAMIRWHRMLGESSLWVPGTDHAAIATENVVLKNLGKKSREEFTREEFLEKCWDWTHKSHATITNQIKKMGASCDWSREAFTFDEKRNFAVNYIFKKLQEKDLIARGKRMINWSVGAQSVLADDEVEWEERTETLYYIRVGNFLMSTVRPETKCADSAIVINAKGKYAKVENADGDYLIISANTWNQKNKFKDLKKEYKLKEIIKGKDLVGQEFEYQTYAGMRKFWVITDDHIDADFGTGSMTISPAHDINDYEIAIRNNLKNSFIQKIDFDGRMTEIAGECAGLTIKECRKKSVEIMKKQGILILEEPYTHEVPLCYRSGCVVEYMLSKQWFISVEKEFLDDFTGKKTTLKKLMQDAVRKNHVEIVPKRFEKIYFNWIDNLRDWCISRQIWWGHRIPVWYDQDENEYFQKIQNLTFARHGESEGNAKSFMQGVTDTKLTNEGKKQAKKLAENLKDKKITKIICSPLTRAKQTAEIISKELNLDVEIWDELHEVNAGNLETQMFKEVFDKEKPTYHEIGKWLFVEKSAEQLSDFYKRANKALENLKKLEEENILIVSHGMFIAAVAANKENIAEENFVEFLKNWNLHKAETYETFYLQTPSDIHEQKITFIRHSETEGNLNYLIGCDYSLTKKGKEETKELTRKLQNRKISKIISSNSKSAKETAEMIAKETGIDPEYWTEFTGVNFGKVTGQNGVKGKLSIDIAMEAKTGESPKEIFNRVKKGWEKLQKIRTEGEILVIGHRTIFTALDLIREGKDEKEFLNNRKNNEEKQHGIWNEIILKKKLDLRQDEDTLDTWFSSALWPFSILGWPEKTADFEKFYPTDVLETGHDILFFWVARMIMFGRFATGKYPFHTVYLHGLVCDANGQKMSKSKGNGIDPLDMIKKFGTDAVRLALVMGTTPGNNINLGEEKIAGCRNFCNKLWNISRFILSKYSPKELEKHQDKEPKTDLQNWMVNKRQKLIDQVSKDFEKHHFGTASEKLWNFTWNEFADWAIEAAKAEDKIETDACLFKTLKILLELWHPFIPFITEKIWSQCGKSSQIITAKYPSLYGKVKTQNANNFEIVIDLVSKIRSLRAEKKVEPAKKIKAFFNGDNTKVIKENAEIIKFLARIEDIQIEKKPEEKCVSDFISGIEINLPLADLIDEKAEKQRIEKELKESENFLKSIEAKLANKNYTDNAPKEVVDRTKQQAEEIKQKISKLKSEI